MEDKKVLNEKELNAVTGGAAEEGLNGHLYAVPTSEVINDKYSCFLTKKIWFNLRIITKLLLFNYEELILWRMQ